MTTIESPRWYKFGLKSLPMIALLSISGILLYAAWVNTIVRPPRFDEAYLLMLIRNASSYSNLLTVASDGAVETPAHLLAVMYLTRLFPTANDLVVTREFSVMCVGVTVLFACLFLKTNFGVFTAVLGCLMFAASEFCWFAAVDGRNYALASALTMLAVWAWDKETLLWDVVAIVAMLLGLFTHYFSLFAIIACSASLLMTGKNHTQAIGYAARRRTRLMLLLCVVLLIFAMVCGANINQSVQARAGGNTIWNEDLSVGKLLEYSLGMPWIPKAGALASIILLCCFVASLVYSICQSQNRKLLTSELQSFLRTRRGMLILFLCLPGIALLMISEHVSPFDFVARYFLSRQLGATC
ncbi:MAG: hypothetical protein C4326_07230 [Ignavibacteria bacterium]